MGTRRQARECVVQILFTLDMGKDKRDAVFADFWKETELDAKSRKFVETHVNGVLNNLARIDELLIKYAQNWNIKRMGVIERNVMRMAVYEMLFCPEIPPVVSINEAVDLSKYFGTAESGKFVNGILDGIRKSINRPARVRQPAAASAPQEPTGQQT